MLVDISQLMYHSTFTASITNITSYMAVKQLTFVAASFLGANKVLKVNFPSIISIQLSAFTKIELLILN